MLLLAALAFAASPVHQAWTALPQTTNHCADDYDYFPGGGLRILWCHAQENLSLAQLQALARAPIWSSGPHRVDKLDLANTRAFGHYNPLFVERAAAALLVGKDDPAFRAATQPVYDGVLRERARIAWAIHEKMLAEPACTKRELDGYVANMRAKAPDPYYYGRWYFFMGADFCNKDARRDDADGGFDGNVADTLVGFWLRRRIDGTEGRFVTALSDLLRTYDGAWFAGPHRTLRE